MTRDELEEVARRQGMDVRSFEAGAMYAVSHPDVGMFRRWLLLVYRWRRQLGRNSRFPLLEDYIKEHWNDGKEGIG